ncbi:MAG: HAD family hydrolase [Actinobacteria bacterium]|nr:MAG: HAD family hydrolase [Actinomycetota bacterium]
MSETPVAVLFDIDGTLISTGGAGAEAWRRAFTDLHGIPANIEDVTEAGMPDQMVVTVTFRHVIGRVPEPREIAALMAKYLEHLPETVTESTGYVVFPGVHELLSRLCDSGHLLGLTTGNIEAAAHIKIARAGLNRFFTFGGYGSDSPNRGELTRIAIQRAATILGAQPAASYVVGDTPRDIEAAHDAAAIAVGVATGHFTVDDLRSAGADYVLRTFADDPFPTAAQAHA